MRTRMRLSGFNGPERRRWSSPGGMGNDPGNYRYTLCECPTHVISKTIDSAPNEWPMPSSSIGMTDRGRENLSATNRSDGSTTWSNRATACPRIQHGLAQLESPIEARLDTQGVQLGCQIWKVSSWSCCPTPRPGPRACASGVVRLPPVSTIVDTTCSNASSGRSPH